MAQGVITKVATAEEKRQKRPKRTPRRPKPISKVPTGLTKADYRGFSKGGVVTFKDISKLK
tara:strand:+ start:58 stop:240 length:183 start_codon:yes stop_codon:yes gene_type:complete